jgi:hypothetical protein
MDNRRPGLDLKFYDNICSDPNGVSFREFMTIINTPLWSSRHRIVHQIRPVPVQRRNGCMGRPR